MDAGHTWSPSKDVYVCSKTPVPVGVEANARLSFCNDKLCDLSVFMTFQGDDAGADAQLKKLMDALREKYGSPKKNQTGGNAPCRAQGLVRCAASGGAYLSQAWEWDSGEKVYLVLKGEQGTATLVVRYVTATQIEASAF